MQKRRAAELIAKAAPELEVEGEMSADMALSTAYQKQEFPSSRLSGPANLLVMPTADAAHITFNFARIVNNAVSIGPILMGLDFPAHVLDPSASVRRVINMTAFSVVEAQKYQKKKSLENKVA